MTVSVTGWIGELKGRETLDAGDVLAVRRSAWPDGRIDEGEAEAIFDVNTAVRATSREWVDFFVEATLAYVVHQQEPRGYVDEAKAAWLIDRIDRDGRVDTLGELELLVKLLESAVSVPERLRSYALAQVEAIVLSGSGPTRDGAGNAGEVDPGSITAAEVALLRRMIFAGGGDGPARVSRSEADMLFRIKDATLTAANDPGWERLFVQGVANHLMAYAGYVPVAREEALRLDAAMDAPQRGVREFASRMGNFGAGWRALFDRSARWDDREDAVAADELVTPGENVWLEARLAADGASDPLEVALLAFLAEERAR